MPVKKFRNAAELNQPIWHTPGEPQLYRTMRRVWSFGQRTMRRRFPPGVYRHRSMAELNAQTERWTMVER